MKLYNIWSPPFQELSGGIRVLYGLKAWLETHGQIVEINGKPDKNKIAIYPEIVVGNPFKSDNIVRYILQKPGLMTTRGIPGPTTFPGEKVFVFSELYNTVGVDKNHIMFLPILNLQLFKDKKQPRKGKCLFMRRKGNIPTQEWSTLFEITDKLIKDQQALADYLNTVEVMYSYGPIGAMNDLARLCGCRVVLIPSEDKFKQTKEEIAKYELCQDFNGISWEKDDGKKLNSDAFRHLYINLRLFMNYKIINFIELTQ